MYPRGYMLPCVSKPFFWQATYDQDTVSVDAWREEEGGATSRQNKLKTEVGRDTTTVRYDIVHHTNT